MLKNIFLLMIIIIIIIQYNNNIDIIVPNLENNNDKEKFNSIAIAYEPKIEQKSCEPKIEQKSYEPKIEQKYHKQKYIEQKSIEQKYIELKSHEQKSDNYQVIDYDKPNPWTKIIFDSTQEYNFNFFIKIKIPSLNDYEKWKEIIPNLDFIPKTGELVIPAKDEPSALALANLIISNLMGYLSINDILEKNLIQISISKCKSHEIVQNKIRLQIVDMLYPKLNLEYSDKEIYIKNKKNKNKSKSNDTIIPYNTNNDNDNDNIEAYGYTDSSYSYI
jgi:hypothetical protein